MAIPYQEKSNGATRHSNRLRRGKVFVASAAAAGLAAIGAGGALVATASNAAASPLPPANANVTSAVLSADKTEMTVHLAGTGFVPNEEYAVIATGDDGKKYDTDTSSVKYKTDEEPAAKADGTMDADVLLAVSTTPSAKGPKTVTVTGFLDDSSAPDNQSFGPVGPVKVGKTTPSLNTPTIQGVCGTQFVNSSGVNAFASVLFTQTGNNLPAGAQEFVQISGPDAAVGQKEVTVGNDGTWNANAVIPESTGANTGWWIGHDLTWYVVDSTGAQLATGKVKLGTDCTGGTPPPPSCESSDKDSNGSTTAWYSDLSWTVNGKAYSSAQKALDAAQPGDKIVLTGNADIPANCTTQALAALYLVPKSSNQILLDSQVVKPESGKSFTLTVTLPVPPNDLVSCNEKYTLQYDSGVGEVLPIIGTDKGKTYLYGKRKFENGYGKASFTAPPCQTETPTPTHTYTPPPVTTSPTPSPTPTSSPSPSPSSSPTPSASPTVAPSPSSSPYVPGPGNTGDGPLNSGPNGQLMAGGLVIIAGLVFVGLAIAEAFGRRPRSGVSD